MTEENKTLDQLIKEAEEKIREAGEYTIKKLQGIAEKYTNKSPITDLILEINPAVGRTISSLKQIQQIQQKLRPAITECEKREKMNEDYKL